ncbi:MAG: GntR family transcriptional regulator [Actinobacteria bacterium]|nr:GntR family transcriptional regulator [Actinomycetota bacterium]
MTSLSPVRSSGRLLTDRVRDQLLSAIHSGELEVGTKIPNEQQLCATFGVSRITVREAVRSLVEGGYLDRVHGSGTYVAFRPSARHSLEQNLSYTAMIREAGMRPSRRLVQLERDGASEHEAAFLQIGAHDEVVRVRRVRYADESPVISSIDTIPAAILGDVDDSAFGGSLYNMLESAGNKVSHAEATVLPVIADADLADILSVDIGSPLLHISQVDWVAGGHAVMFSREWHVPGVFELSLLRRPSSSDTTGF